MVPLPRTRTNGQVDALNADAFDRLSRRMGAATTRRGLLRAFAAGLGALAAGRLVPGAPGNADAARPGIDGEASGQPCGDNPEYATPCGTVSGINNLGQPYSYPQCCAQNATCCSAANAACCLPNQTCYFGRCCNPNQSFCGQSCCDPNQTCCDGTCCDPSRIAKTAPASLRRRPLRRQTPAPTSGWFAARDKAAVARMKTARAAATPTSSATALATATTTAPSPATTPHARWVTRAAEDQTATPAAPQA